MVLVPVALLTATMAAAPAASAENNGVGLTPAMGWSTWSFLRRDPSAAEDEVQAQALVSSGLNKVGYQYVNQDDFWYPVPRERWARRRPLQRLLGHRPCQVPSWA
jgi:hypothetical protein